MNEIKYLGFCIYTCIVLYFPLLVEKLLSERNKFT